MAHQIIRELDLEGLRKEPLADFEVGDTVNVHTLIKEGDKSRTQIFTGTVIRRNKSHNPSCANFTVRRIVDGEASNASSPSTVPTLPR